MAFIAESSIAASTWLYIPQENILKKVQCSPKRVRWSKNQVQCSAKESDSLNAGASQKSAGFAFARYLVPLLRMGNYSAKGVSDVTSAFRTDDTMNRTAPPPRPTVCPRHPARLRHLTRITIDIERQARQPKKQTEGHCVCWENGSPRRDEQPRPKPWEASRL